MKLVLFDIDGTILWTDGAGRRAIHRALLDVTGMAGPIESYRFDGKTDPQIVRELLSAAGHAAAENETQVAAVCRRYVELLQLELAKSEQRTKLFPGVRELLAALEPHERAGHSLRSEEHTSELQSPDHLVCRLLLEKKKQDTTQSRRHGRSRVSVTQH